MEYLVHRVKQNELEHYGRKGMKWYQHIFGTDKAYSMSVKKLKKLNAKAQKHEARAAKLNLKSAKREQRAYRTINERRHRRQTERALRYKRQSAKASYKSVKARKKAKDWANSMNEYFSDLKLESISSDDVAIGRQYAVKAIEDFLEKNR